MRRRVSPRNFLTTSYAVAPLASAASISSGRFPEPAKASGKISAGSPLVMTARMWSRSWNSRKVRISRSTQGEFLVAGEQMMISQREFFSARRMREAKAAVAESSPSSRKTRLIFLLFFSPFA